MIVASTVFKANIFFLETSALKADVSSTLKVPSVEQRSRCLLGINN